MQNPGYLIVAVIIIVLIFGILAYLTRPINKRYRRKKTPQYPSDVIDISKMNTDKTVKYILHELEVATENFSNAAEISISSEIAGTLKNPAQITMYLALKGAGPVFMNINDDDSLTIKYSPMHS